MKSKKKATLNVLFNFINQFVTIGIGILIPRLVLVNFGSEINGFLNSVTQIYTYIALVEAGVGTATLQVLYKPVASDDKKSINEILSATSRYYRRAGIIYLGLIVAFAAIYPLVVRSDIDYWTMILVILFNGLGGVISFFFQGKFRMLMQAEGKNYVLTNLSTISHLLTGFSKVVLLLLGCNVIALQIAYFVIHILQMLYLMIYVKRKYKWIDLSAKPNYESLNQKNAVLVGQVSYLVFNNTDTILLSVFTGLKVVSVYSLYNMVFNMVRTLLENIFGSVTFIMGQTFNQDIKKYTRFHDIYETMHLTVAFILYATANLLVIPFIRLYTDGIFDIQYVDAWLPVMFASMCLLSAMRGASGQVINFAQHFKKTQSRTIAEAIINIVSSLLLVFKFGIYGVILGSILALLYRTNDMIIYANKVILKRSPWKTYRKCCINIVLFLAIDFAKRYFIDQVENYLHFFVLAIIVVFTLAVVFITVNLAFDRESRRWLFDLLRKKLGRKTRTE